MTSGEPSPSTKIQVATSQSSRLLSFVYTRRLSKLLQKPGASISHLMNPRSRRSLQSASAVVHLAPHPFHIRPCPRVPILTFTIAPTRQGHPRTNPSRRRLATGPPVQHVDLPAAAPCSPRRPRVSPSIATQTDREVPLHRTYDSTPRPRDLDHAFVVGSPDRSPHQHTSPHVDPLHPAPHAAPVTRSLGPELGTRIPQEYSDQSKPRTCESHHAIKVDKPHLHAEPHCGPLDCTPGPTPVSRFLAPVIGTHVPQDHSDTEISHARESDRAAVVDKPIF
jgi:hypothetical protein